LTRPARIAIYTIGTRTTKGLGKPPRKMGALNNLLPVFGNTLRIAFQSAQNPPPLTEKQFENHLLGVVQVHALDLRCFS